MLRRHAGEHGYDLDIFYSNIEGEAINRIYRAVEEGFDGLVMNPAGFTYAGFALKDCIKGASLPYVEVHISNIAKRNIHCVLSDVAEGFITGFGMHSYILGLEAMMGGQSSGGTQQLKHGLLSRQSLIKGESEADLVDFGKRLRTQLAPIGDSNSSSWTGLSRRYGGCDEPWPWKPRSLTERTSRIVPLTITDERRWASSHATK